MQINDYPERTTLADTDNFLVETENNATLKVSHKRLFEKVATIDDIPKIPETPSIRLYKVSFTAKYGTAYIIGNGANKDYQEIEDLTKPTVPSGYYIKDYVPISVFPMGLYDNNAEISMGQVLVVPWLQLVNNSWYVYWYMKNLTTTNINFDKLIIGINCITKPVTKYETEEIITQHSF